MVRSLSSRATSVPVISKRLGRCVRPTNRWAAQRQKRQE